MRSLVVTLALVGCTSPPVNPDHGKYVASRITIPDQRQLVHMLALDVNGDGVTDNALGSLLATIGGQARVSDSTAAAIGRDEILMLVDYTPTDSDTGRLTTLAGASPATQACNGIITLCSNPVRHFEVASRDTAMTGAWDGTAFDGGPGTVTLPLATTAGIVEFPLVGARAHAVGISTSGIVSAIVGGGIQKADIDGIVVPAIEAVVQHAVATDCTGIGPPSCGCTTATAGDTDIGFFDSNHDCTISDAEIHGNATLQSLLAPDTTIDGHQVWSVGFEIEAIEADF